MLVLMTGAWLDKPNYYDSVRAYLDGEDGQKLEDFTNQYIKEHLPKAPKFVLGEAEKHTVEQYIELHKAEAYPNADGSFDKSRFMQLCDNAVDHIFRVRNYYTMYR